MESSQNTGLDRKYRKTVVVISILIPLVVMALFSVKLRDFGIDVAPMRFLPPVYATINGITAILLILAVAAIYRGNRVLHQRLVTTALFASAAFLVMYVMYHLTSDSTKFGDANFDGVVDAAELAVVGSIRFVYYFILLTHILLSVIIIPLVLFTYLRGLSGDFVRHRKIARIAFPIWVYVAITGVVVYLMISPYYAP